MGISRDSRHKRSATGAQRASYRKKRKFELGRQPANTRIGAKRIHEVRVRGGNQKFRALRLDSGNFTWPSENVAKKTRIIAVLFSRSVVPNDRHPIIRVTTSWSVPTPLPNLLLCRSTLPPSVITTNHSTGLRLASPSVLRKLPRQRLKLPGRSRNLRRQNGN